MNLQDKRVDMEDLLEDLNAHIRVEARSREDDGV